MAKIPSHSKIIIESFNHNFEKDKRFLIPFIQGTKVGFCDTNREIVISPSYDVVLDDFHHQLSLVRVGKYMPVDYPNAKASHLRLIFGLIDASGKYVIPLYYEGIAAPENSMVFTVRSLQNGYAVIDERGSIVVPFGRYSYIDGFADGYSRVKIGRSNNGLTEFGDKWGIIKEDGTEIVPPSANSISRFYKSNVPYCTINDGEREYEFHLIDGKIQYSGYYEDKESEFQKEMEDYESLCRYKESQSDVENLFDPFDY